tara:strand:- start:379 stop:1110 length:732 start_codon:yes stop_codon:yes gene_type:complete
MFNQNILLNKDNKDLSSGYRKVADKFFEINDFKLEDIKKSRLLFTNSSLGTRKPIPEKLDVYGLLSGLSFDETFTDKLFLIQQIIKSKLKSSLAYFVEPSNMGIEHCVLKWPEESWNKQKEELALISFENYNFKEFELFIYGIQIHVDGCIVAKGYPSNNAIKDLRNYLSNDLKFFPKKQSKWAHIPLGRILEPLGNEKFKELQFLVREFYTTEIASTLIKSYKFIHESQWYMEERRIIKEYI